MADQSFRWLYRIRSKTDRAHKHIIDVQTLAREPFKTAGDISFFVDSKGELQGPQKYRLLDIEILCAAGDAIHNMRSALDHLAWSLVEANRVEPTKSCGFPIAETLKEFEAIKTRKIAGMSSEAQDFITNEVRPYKECPESTWLWQIHHLDIVDKHRELYGIGYQNLVGGNFIGMFGTQTDKPTHFPGIFIDDPDGEYKSPGQPTVAEFRGIQPQPLLPTLNELLENTKSLIESFRPFLV
jgi:hypothetical protein